jgi:hypothetical protein
VRAATGMQRSSGGSAHDARAGASSGAQVALHPSPDAAWAGAGCGAQSLPRLATPLTDTWSCDELASRGEHGLPTCRRARRGWASQRRMDGILDPRINGGERRWVAFVVRPFGTLNSRCSARGSDRYQDYTNVLSRKERGRNGEQMYPVRTGRGGLVPAGHSEVNRPANRPIRRWQASSKDAHCTAAAFHDSSQLWGFVPMRADCNSAQSAQHARRFTGAPGALHWGTALGHCNVSGADGCSRNAPGTGTCTSGCKQVSACQLSN